VPTTDALGLYKADSSRLEVTKVGYDIPDFITVSKILQVCILPTIPLQYSNIFVTDINAFFVLDRKI